MNKKIMDAMILHFGNQFAYLAAGLITRTESFNFVSGYLMALEEAEILTEEEGEMILRTFLSLI